MRKLAGSLLLCAALSLTAAGTAQAQASRPAEALSAIEELPIAKANPDVPHEVIASLPEVVQASDAILSEDFKAGTPIVYPDGTPVEGQSAELTAEAETAAAACNMTVWGPPLRYGGEIVCSVAVWGHPGYYKGYSWGLMAGANTTACVQGRGYNSSRDGAPTWYGLSCGSSGGRDVPWGNVIGNPAARAMSQTVLGAYVNWFA